MTALFDDDTGVDGLAERAAGDPAGDPADLICRGNRSRNRPLRPGNSPANRKADSGRASTRPNRPPLNDDLVAYVARRLTSRDRSMLDLLAEHRVFTTDQLADAFFGSATTARHRLTQLHQLRVLQRFAPFIGKGSAPYHYVLDQLGASVVAAERGEEPKRYWRQDRALILSRSQRLAHLVGTNGFFTSLMGKDRRRSHCKLLAWWGEYRCKDWCGHLVCPDGYGAWREGRDAVDFLLEFDRGTETHERLAAKLEGYGHLADAVRRQIPVLFLFHSHRRESAARNVLGDSGLAVATGVVDPGGALATRWLPIGENTRRRLVDLAGLGGREFRTYQRPRGAWPEWYYADSAPMPPATLSR